MSVADLHAGEAERLLACAEHPQKWVAGLDPAAADLDAHSDKLVMLPADSGTVDVTPALAAAQVHATLAVEARVAEGNKLLRDLLTETRRTAGRGAASIRNRRRD